MAFGFVTNKMVPDHSYIVDQTAAEFPELLRTNTIDSIQRFMQILGPRLAQQDMEWGYLTKTQGEKHITLEDGTLVSVDSFIYLSTQQVIDVLSNGADPDYGPARPSWTERPKRDNNNWYPISEGNNPPDETNPPYDRLDNRVSVLEGQVAYLTRIIEGGMYIGLKASSGKFVCDERGHSNVLAANRDNLGPWEKFRIIPSGEVK